MVDNIESHLLIGQEGCLEAAKYMNKECWLCLETGRIMNL